jgi:predicted flap endonuclease-1-like 5' DNA nuclease
MTPGLTLFILVIVILIVWFSLLRNARTYKPDFEMHGHGEEQHTHEVETHEAPAVESQPVPEIHQAERAAIQAPVHPDDLTIIEGIGPKVNQLLQAAGIQSFTQLAGSNTESLKAILEPAGLQFIDPGSWPEQARLISEGKMEAFDELTKRLRSGRQVN